MKTTIQIQRNPSKLYILFADLKEYSANKHDLNLILKMETALYEIGRELFPENEHCFKVLGDGMLATDKNALVLAQKALKIIEIIKNTFEQDQEFTKKPQIRIALHLTETQSVSERYLTYDLGEHKLTIFKDIAGEDVINTARIEPIVKPNYVFCSAAFAQELKLLKEMNMNPDIEVISLDSHKLGKEHDSFEVELFTVYHKNQVINPNELKEHIQEKLNKREETYQDVSPLTSGYVNYGTQVIVNLTQVDVKGYVNLGNKNIIQNAEKTINIEKIDKADFN